MRILFVIPYFYPAEAFGGPVKVAFDVGKELVKRGHEVVVFTSDAKDLKNRLEVKSDEIEGMKVHYFRNSSMFFVKWSKLFITPELSRKMKSDLKSFDVVHVHEYTTYQNIVVHKFAKRYGIPYVLQAHGSLPRIDRQVRKWFYDVFFGSNLLRDASNLIALSQIEAEQYHRAGVPYERISVIPNGIDLSRYTNLPPRGSFRRKFDVSDDKKIILYLGRFHKIKGLDFLVKACAYLIRNLKHNNVIVAIAGPDDGYLAATESLVRQEGLEEQVLLPGPLYDNSKLECYVDSDIYVLPSRYETFPMGLLEAYACGKPVIASNINGLRELVTEKNGLLVEFGDEAHLANCLKWMLTHQDKALEMGRAGRCLVEEGFTIKTTVDKLEKTYKEALGTRCYEFH